MMRLLMVLVVLLMVGVAMPGCEDEGSNAAADFGVQEGPRPKDQPKRPPPGPPVGGFTSSSEGTTTESPPPGDEDSSDD